MVTLVTGVEVKERSWISSINREKDGWSVAPDLDKDG